jgi:hypothetical protein
MKGRKPMQTMGFQTSRGPRSADHRGSWVSSLAAETSDATAHGSAIAYAAYKRRHAVMTVVARARRARR